MAHPLQVTSSARGARYLYLALLTVFVGNFSFHPFGTGFRFSLAVGAFTFFLLLNDDLNPLMGGLVTGVAILLFRAGGNVLLLEMPLPSALHSHFPAMVFYVILGAGMLLLRGILQDGGWPVYIVLGLLDIGANVVELAVRRELLSRALLPTLYLLALVAIFRATLVGLAFTAWRQHERIMRQDQERTRFEKVLLVTSDVTGELLYMGSTRASMDRIMLHSHQLYNRLKADNNSYAESALGISRDIHDAKKDLDRLSARMEQVLSRQQEGESVALTLLVDIAVRANQALARDCGKDIDFLVDVRGEREVLHYHSLLSIINNLVGNAVESIPERGEVRLEVDCRPAELVLRVSDTGSGIRAADMDVIFSPGYTTKFDPATGQAFTGLGLSQVRHIVDELRGSIQVESREGAGSSFRVILPYVRRSPR